MVDGKTIMVMLMVMTVMLIAVDKYTKHKTINIYGKMVFNNKMVTAKKEGLL